MLNIFLSKLRVRFFSFNFVLSFVEPYCSFGFSGRGGVEERSRGGAGNPCVPPPLRTPLVVVPLVPVQKYYGDKSRDTASLNLRSQFSVP